MPEDRDLDDRQFEEEYDNDDGQHEQAGIPAGDLLHGNGIYYNYSSKKSSSSRRCFFVGRPILLWRLPVLKLAAWN
jgi:hypothetical protein